MNLNTNSHIWDTGFHPCENVKVDEEMYTMEVPRGLARSSSRQLMLSLPGLVLLVVSAGLDVSRQFYLHVSKKWNHLQLLHSHNEKREYYIAYPVTK